MKTYAQEPKLLNENGAHDPIDVILVIEHHEGMFLAEHFKVLVRGVDRQLGR